MTTQRMTQAGLTVPQRILADTFQLSGVIAQPEVFDYERVDTSPVGGEIDLSNRAYQGYGVARFAIQDIVGRLDLNTFQRGRFQCLLSGLGIPTRTLDSLVSKLEDYTDLDDLHRINGAERRQYEELSLPPPNNRYLRTPQEVRRILGWSKYEQLWQNNNWSRYTTTLNTGFPNINTSPFAVLQTLPGFSATNAQQILAYRKIQPFADSFHMQRVLDLPFPVEELNLSFLPSERFRLTLWYEGAPSAQQINIWLTPSIDKDGPWRIEYELTVPISDNYRQASVDKVQSILLNPDFLEEVRDAGVAENNQ
ncbi:MAG: hypothetical protein AAF512_22320 [Pseudomonadota bacterium]